MWPFKKIFQDKNALDAYLKFKTYKLKDKGSDRAFQLFIVAFIFINILAIIINIKTIGEYFFPGFRSQVNWILGSMWAVVAGRRFLEIIFRRPEPPKSRSKTRTKKSSKEK
jgi:hypothetical protein